VQYSHKQEKQLLNEMEVQIQIIQQCPDFSKTVLQLIKIQLQNNSKKAELQFLEKFKNVVNKYFIRELKSSDLEEFVYELWTV
jgi:hypothetical protein